METNITLNALKHIVKVSLCLFIMLCLAGNIHATDYKSTGSGSWTNTSTWMTSSGNAASSVPGYGDNVTIQDGHNVSIGAVYAAVNDLRVDGTLKWNANKTLKILGDLTVNGELDMTGGLVSIQSSSTGQKFKIGQYGKFTWDPNVNTMLGASLFINCEEEFAATSTLIIKNWFDYSVPLCTYITGNFGNLELNSKSGTTIYEWNQDNGFESHRIQGALTIDKGWITLDKSGSISNTTFGSIILKNGNSTFYGHNGTHPSHFTITTGAIANTGGNFYGLNDGNGDITLNVTGFMANTGNVKIINNSGVSGVSNGNATFKVTGNYSQSGATADTRIIYNVSSTNSGLFNATFGSLNLNGGIFMGQTGCRTSGGNCEMKVSQNFTIAFSNTTDKFRGTSISSIGGSMNAARFNLTVGGDFSVSGTTAAEVTTSASSGPEEITINGNTYLKGCTVSFNYGSATAGHNHVINWNGDLTIEGSTVFLSRNSGTATIDINTMTMKSGNCIVKGADSAATLDVENFVQTGGNFYLHNNAIASTMPVNMNVKGTFTQSSGTFNFETSYDNSAPTNVLTISGNTVNLNGGSITHAGPGSSLSWGMILYDAGGTITFNRVGNHWISQVKQVIKNGTALNVASTTFQIAGHSIADNNFMEVEPGGILNMANGQIVSSNAFANTGFRVDSGATISTQRVGGFYEVGGSGCVNPSNNMTFFLSQNSTVEYNGTSNQVLTPNTSSASAQHMQYGILRIKMANGSSKVLMNSDVTVRTKLVLETGEVNLNGKALTIKNGAANAISRINGYVNGELNSLGQAGSIVWKGMMPGTHEFPFGTDLSSYIPVQFSPVKGMNKDVTVSTYSTSANNIPVPVADRGIVGFSMFGHNFAANSIVDRWWNISASKIMANVTVSYKASENTLMSSMQSCSMNILQWNGTGWTIGSAQTSGVVTGIGTATVNNTGNFSAWAVGHSALGSGCRTEPLSFDAERMDNNVALRWTSAAEPVIEYFGVERSSDGETFEEISRKQTMGNSNSALNYSVVDENPLTGTSYYRLKLANKDGMVSYSDARKIYIPEAAISGVSIEKFGPNPFSESFSINYKINTDGEVHFQFSNSAGQIISNTKFQETKGSHNYEFNQGDTLKPGIYFLKLIFNDKVVTQKLIKK